MPVNYNTPLDGTPATIYMATTEKVPLAFDFTANMLQGESVATPGSELMDLTINGALITLTDPPVIQTGSTTTLIQEMQGAEIRAGHTYRLVVSADIQGLVAGKRLSISTVIIVPF